MGTEWRALAEVIQQAARDWRPADERNPMACDARRPAAADHIAKSLASAGICRTRVAEPIWVLAVTPHGMGEGPSVSIHRTYAAAIEWLRTGWDSDGDYKDITDGDTFIDRLRDVGYGVIIEGLVPEWLGSK